MNSHIPSNPKMVIISDLHFNPHNLELSCNALRDAIHMARRLHTRLVISGDLHDTKAIIRGEVANALLNIFQDASVPIHILVGNHDLLNERGTDHGLNYLRELVNVVDSPYQIPNTDTYLFPYYNDPSKLSLELEMIPPNSTLVMHQGFLGAEMGDYVRDLTSIGPEVVKKFKVFSGHYHRHQTLGTVTYVGNPYTMSYGECNDGPKGYLVVFEDNSFHQVALYYRKHVKLAYRIEKLPKKPLNYSQDDLIWLQVSGPQSQLKALDKFELGNTLFGRSNYKLDLIADKSVAPTPNPVTPIESPPLQLNAIVESLQETQEHKAYIKEVIDEILTG